MRGRCVLHLGRGSPIDIESIVHQHDGMIKTQIQLPDDLYHDLKRLAGEKEWSLAETMRRSAEEFLARYPRASATSRTGWAPPSSGRVGWKGLTASQLREQAMVDMEPRP